MPGQCILGVFSIFHRQLLAESRARVLISLDHDTPPNHCECLGPRTSLSLDWPWLRKQKKMKSGQGFLFYMKVIHKVRQRRHRNPLFRHIRDEISKNGEKKYTELQRGTKLSLAANLVLNWVFHVLSFPERFQPITVTAMCTVARLEWLE
jgi:hypothetical protein